jgi:hypothetical protein
MTKRPARQPPASRRCPPPATGTREEQPPRDGQTGPEAELDAHIARLVADAPPLTSAQRDQLALILRRSAATGTKPPDRPVRQCAVPAAPGPGGKI